MAETAWLLRYSLIPMNLRLLTICHMAPSRVLPRHGIFLRRQARALRPLGIESTFLVARPWAPWPLTRIPRWKNYGAGNPLLEEKDFAHHGVHYVRPPGEWFRRFEAGVMARALAGAAWRLHTAAAFDAILACPLFPDAVAAVEIKDNLSLPLAALAIGSDVMVYSRRMPILERQLRRTLARVDLSLGVSEAICQRLRELGASEAKRITLVRNSALFKPCGDRTALRRELGWADDAQVAVYAGLLAPSKGMKELAAAALPLLEQHPSFQLVCIGSGPAEEDLVSSQHPRLQVLGELAPESIPPYLQAADFLVFPSHSEGMPQTVLEAMQCGLPVVATAVGGIPEAVTHEDNGLLVPPRRAEALLRI